MENEHVAGSGRYLEKAVVSAYLRVRWRRDSHTGVSLATSTASSRNSMNRVVSLVMVLSAPIQLAQIFLITSSLMSLPKSFSTLLSLRLLALSNASRPFIIRGLSCLPDSAVHKVPRKGQETFKPYNNGQSVVGQDLLIEYLIRIFAQNYQESEYGETSRCCSSAIATKLRSTQAFKRRTAHVVADEYVYTIMCALSRTITLSALSEVERMG